MTADLAIRTGLPGRLLDNGYILPPDLSYDEWRNVLALTEHIAEASPWWLGDAIVYGERRFPDRHAQALPTAEEDPQGARQSRMKSAAWVSSKFPPVTRVTELSWSHHRAVAEFEPVEARRLLMAAVNDKLSTRDLIEKARVHKENLLGRAATIDGEAAASADLPWTPGKSDLTEDARAALNVRLAAMGKRHAIGFEAGFIAALLWAEVLDAFERHP
jgi:hypothetical protein